MIAVTSEVLSQSESEALARCEAVIEQGVARFLEIGIALREIHAKKLYRQDYDSFEQYLDRRWSISRPQGYRLLRAAAVVENVSPHGDIPAPTTEAQARELAALPPAKQCEAWRLAVESSPDGPPTAPHVKKVVASLKAGARPAPDRAGAVVARLRERLRAWERQYDRFIAALEKERCEDLVELLEREVGVDAEATALRLKNHFRGESLRELLRLLAELREPEGGDDDE